MTAIFEISSYTQDKFSLQAVQVLLKMHQKSIETPPTRSPKNQKFLLAMSMDSVVRRQQMNAYH